MAIDKKWVDTATQLLGESLAPLPHELNELDWKIDVSDKSTAKHISAFSNYTYGGYLIFGINDQGEINGVDQEKIREIIAKIGAIARNGVEPKVSIDHAVITYKEKTLLFVFIKESKEKPVHIRGKGLEESYMRSGGATHKMSKQEIGRCLLKSEIPKFEEQDADISKSPAEIIDQIDIRAFFNLLKIPLPENQDSIMNKLEEYHLVKSENRMYIINNLGVLLAAQDMAHFFAHTRRGVRVICYKGSSKIEAIQDETFDKGYAIGFGELLDYIQKQLPSSEVIKNAFRENVTVYPLIAIRELLANAIIHQDFGIDSSHPKVEIFSDRMEITNPGTLIPKTSVDRLFGSTYPRNELFARIMYKMRICEDRGSGLIRALTEIELYGLPPLKFEISETTFKVILYAPKNYQDMSRQERIDACFQHCVLKHLSNENMTNASLRERLGIHEKNYAIASRIIKDALDKGQIKIGNPEIKNAKYIYYKPFYV